MILLPLPLAVLVAIVTARQDTTHLTLAASIDRALASHPTVAVARAQRERARADLGDARAAQRPRLVFDGSLTRFQEPMVVLPLHGLDLRNPPLFDRTLVQSGLSLSWTVADFGIRSSRVRAQAALGDAADAALSGAQQQLIAETVRAYLRVLTGREVLVAVDQRLAALTAAATQTRLLFTSGKAARVDELRVEAALQRAAADRIASASSVEVAERELAQLTDLPYERVKGAPLSALRLADSTFAVDSSAALRALLLQRAAAANPLMRELTERVRAAGAALGAAHAGWYPEVRLASAYIDRGRWAGNFSGEWQVGVGVSYPIYTGGSRISGIDRAEADADAAAQQLRVLRLAEERGVDQSLAALREAHARVIALQSALDQSLEVTRIERLALDAGSGTQSEFLDAEADLFSVRASLAEARHAEIGARVELARLTGELSPAWIARTMESSS